MSGYLIYHPPRFVSQFDTLTVYHDAIGGNQDPYLWNTRFLHTYCHITQMSPAVGHINFWVSGDTFYSQEHCSTCQPVNQYQATKRKLIDVSASTAYTHTSPC